MQSPDTDVTDKTFHDVNFHIAKHEEPFHEFLVKNHPTVLSENIFEFFFRKAQDAEAVKVDVHNEPQIGSANENKMEIEDPGKTMVCIFIVWKLTFS